MSQYRTQNRTILGKIETTAGTDASPVVGTDALTCISPSWSGGPEALSNDNEVTGALDVGSLIVGVGGASFGFSVNVKGSGVAGTAPEYGWAIRAAAMAETLTASDVTGTAQAGATLAAGASAVDDLYVGMVIETTGGTQPLRQRLADDDKSLAGRQFRYGDVPALKPGADGDVLVAIGRPAVIVEDHNPAARHSIKQATQGCDFGRR